MPRPAPRIVLADGDAVVGRALVEYAQAHGYEVTVAATWDEARAALASGPVAVLVCAIDLPGGAGLMREVHLEARFAGVSVVHRVPPSLGVPRDENVVDCPSHPAEVLVRIEALWADRRTERRPCVFVVDDSDDCRETTALALESAGMHVFRLASVPGALALLAGVLPDLVVTDLAMPDLSGLDLVEAMRARGIEVPVVAVTGRVDMLASVRPKVDTVFVKPVELDALASRVIWLARYRQR